MVLDASSHFAPILFGGTYGFAARRTGGSTVGFFSSFLRSSASSFSFLRRRALRERLRGFYQIDPRFTLTRVHIHRCRRLLALLFLFLALLLLLVGLSLGLGLPGLPGLLGHLESLLNFMLVAFSIDDNQARCIRATRDAVLMGAGTTSQGLEVKE